MIGVDSVEFMYRRFGQLLSPINVVASNSFLHSVEKNPLVKSLHPMSDCRVNIGVVANGTDSSAVNQKVTASSSRLLNILEHLRLSRNMVSM
jgi:hypothetical protein